MSRTILTQIIIKCSLLQKCCCQFVKEMFKKISKYTVPSVSSPTTWPCNLAVFPSKLPSSVLPPPPGLWVQGTPEKTLPTDLLESNVSSKAVSLRLVGWLESISLLSVRPRYIGNKIANFNLIQFLLLYNHRKINRWDIFMFSWIFVIIIIRKLSILFC